MAGEFRLERVSTGKNDFILFLVCLILLGTGLSALFSSSYYNAARYYDDSFMFIRKQVIMAAAGILLGCIAGRLSAATLKRFTPALLLVSIILMLLCFVPGVGAKILGARRWIYIAGFSFQPSELAKLALVMYLAGIFEKKKDRMNDFVNSVLPPLIVTGLVVGVVFMQNDFSTGVFILINSMIIFFIAGVPFLYFIFLMTAIVPISLILLFTKPHRVERLIAFLNPEFDPVGSGYQVISAQSALANGGLWGRGIGQGVKKLGALPEVHSDFIFASVAEETGFIGVLCIIILFCFFAFRAYRSCRQTEDRYRFLMVFGLTTSIFYQAVFNLAVICGLVPPTGIPLPFFSSGGSSMLVTLVMCGLIIGMTRTDDGGRGL